MCGQGLYTDCATKVVPPPDLDPNQAFMMLHALIVARLSPLSTGTPQLEKFMAGKLNLRYRRSMVGANY